MLNKPLERLDRKRQAQQAGISPLSYANSRRCRDSGDCLECGSKYQDDLEGTHMVTTPRGPASRVSCLTVTAAVALALGVALTSCGKAPELPKAPQR